MPPVLQGQKLVKEYRLGQHKVFALNDVSLEISQGELVAVAGKSGGGKSTLLHTMGCLQRPTSGRMLVEGREVTRLNDKDLARVRGQRIGFVYQAFNLLPNETALRNVELPLEYQGVSSKERERLARKALEGVGLGDRAAHKPDQLSGGQRQRIAIARALVHDPATILADEPTGSLDSRSSAEVMAVLRGLNRDGRTVVIVSHDQGFAAQCRRIVVMSDGKVIDDRANAPAPMQVHAGPAPAEGAGGRVCSRCNQDNTPQAAECAGCGFPLELTGQDVDLLRKRLSGEHGVAGVESTSEQVGVAWGSLLGELKAVPLFSGLDAGNLTKLLSSLKEGSHWAGEVIIHQGDPGDRYYIVRRGSVEVQWEGPSGKSSTVATLGPGDGFGELALLTGATRTATVRATSNVQVWSLGKADLQTLMEENLALAMLMHRTVGKRLIELQKHKLA